MPLSANLFRLESSIQKHAGSKGAVLVGDAGSKASRKKKKMSNIYLKKNCAYVADDFKNYFLLRKKKCSKNLVGFTAEMPLSADLFRLESSIQKHAGSRGAVLVGDAGGRSPPLIKKIERKIFDNKNFKFFSNI